MTQLSPAAVPLERRRAGLRIFVVGVGGQGSLLASKALGRAAMQAGLPVVLSEVHGMSQRGGSVESTVLVGKVRSPLIGRGDADILLAFEPSEALRYRHLAGPTSTVVMNTEPIIPFTVSIGAAAYPAPEKVVEALARMTARVHAVNAARIAASAGSALAVNSVLLGTLAGTGLLPFPAETLRAVLLESLPERLRPVNDKAFSAGIAAAG